MFGDIALAAPPNYEWGGTCNFDRLFYICGDPVASLHSEAAGLLSILQKEDPAQDLS